MQGRERERETPLNPFIFLFLHQKVNPVYFHTHILLLNFPNFDSFRFNLIFSGETLDFPLRPSKYKLVPDCTTPMARRPPNLLSLHVLRCALPPYTLWCVNTTCTRVYKDSCTTDRPSYLNASGHCTNPMGLSVPPSSCHHRPIQVKNGWGLSQFNECLEMWSV